MRRFAVLSSVLLLTALSFGQSERGIAGYCPYGCGPYIPLITTPSLSFATVSSDPVGATNATGGLVAGATNSTLSEVQGSTDATYTVPVWYSGGQTPFISPTAATSPMMEVPRHERRMRGLESGQESGRELGKEDESPSTEQAWIYFTSAEQAAAPGQVTEGGKARQATRTYSNEDVSRQNQQNGLVKYKGKSEKIQ
ncbi:MAG TPA: hypothetical protein VN901_16100 [Candidatus Acidoferrales bacterium]|nr:hypothetical protein [Candidatus Acidoferrales bacterium]